MSSFFARAYSTLFSSRSRNHSSNYSSNESSSLSHLTVKEDNSSSLFRKTTACGPLAHHQPSSSSFHTIKDKEEEIRDSCGVNDHSRICSSDDCQARILREFSRSTCSTVLIQEEECVLCLDEFSSENPQVYTLCSCGENRTKFHFPCLLMWLEKKPVCPTCDSALFYQEGIYLQPDE